MKTSNYISKEEEEDEEEQRAARIAVSEQTFQFIDFAKRFVHPRVVQACSLILRQFERNTVHTNHCALKLLHRIAFDCKGPAILFQATLFRTFQRIFESTDRQYKELQKFAVFIMRKFTQVALINSKVYMELLFWKTSRDAYDIENGYGSYQTQSHSTKQVWGEEEEDELHRLHAQFMGITEGVGEGDIVDWIMKNMINKDRSRRGVIKKLKELGYTVGPKNTRKSVDVRPAKEWSPEEEEQLTALYQQFKDAYDPMGRILDHLTVRRPKTRVIDKLLSMGLVNDKKELYKKRGARKSRGNESGGSSGDSGRESDSDDGDSGPPRRKAPTPAQRPKAGKSSKASKPKRSSRAAPSYSSAEATRLLAEVIAADMTEAIQWIAESLEETAEDCEQDPADADEGVPLLPLSEAAVLAMDDPLFHRMLSALGLAAPADEQEIYWRIPANLSPADLRSRKATIDQAIAGPVATGDDFEQGVADTCRKILSENAQDLEGNVSDDEDESQHSTDILQAHSVGVHGSDSEEDQSLVNTPANPSTLDSESEGERVNIRDTSARKESSKKKKKKKKTAVILVDGSESEDETAGAKVTGVVDLDTVENMATTSKRRMIDSDSEDETAGAIVNGVFSLDTEEIMASASKKRVMNSDSEDETLGVKVSEVVDLETGETMATSSKKRVIDSDSEDETLNIRKTRKVVLVSDDED